MAVVVDIDVQDIDGVIALYDGIQIGRSLEGLPYSDASAITSTAAAAAYVTTTNRGDFNEGLNGLTLLLRVDGGAEQTVTFASADPISNVNALSEINAQTTGLTATENASGYLVLTSDTTGTTSTIWITGGTGLTVLGLTQWSIDYGEDANVTLVAGTNKYVYTDNCGYLTFNYRWRYFNSITATYSSWSDWVKPSSQAVVTAGNLITGTVKLANVSGKPMAGAVVAIKYTQGTLIADNYFIADGAERIVLDAEGYGYVNLVKGAEVDVVLEGTSQIRRITVPSTGSTFDLMDATLVTDDPFQIQRQTLPAAVRRS